MADRKLAKEIAVITGSDSGIGQATAIAFAVRVQMSLSPI